jgi:transcriptional regulator with GAF, ATPase, and Fis domain
MVMVSESEFFREVTLRLCRHLAIEDGLHACLEYLSTVMPASRLHLHKYDRPMGSMRIVAGATMTSGERMNVLVRFPKEARAVMDLVRDAFIEGALPAVIVINDPENEPVMRQIHDALGEPLSSAMSLPLIVEGEPQGSLVVSAPGSDRFTDAHAERFAQLRELFFLAMTNMLKHREVVDLKDLLVDDNRHLHRELRQIAGRKIVGASFGLKRTMEMVRKVAPLDSPVLLLGETGVGKDVIANAIHYSSPRKDGPFVKVNSGAIPDSLLDSELFGHEKGAFTGAVTRKRGRFERASKGTIFLDEIGELPLEAQVRMLRVLQEREIERVGGSETIPVDIRIIAATNRDLPRMVQDGRFREDLWFRLNVFPITLPPLRERSEDIPALVSHFIEHKARALRLSVIPEVAPGTIELLGSYTWPGNLRELENIVERALILDSVGPLRFDDLIPTRGRPITAKPSSLKAEGLRLDEVLSAHISRVLEMTGGRVQGQGGAAELLGVKPNTLRSRMQKLNIPYGRRS